jgi:preprotein translocase subunit YajC
VGCAEHGDAWFDVPRNHPALLSGNFVVERNTAMNFLMGLVPLQAQSEGSPLGAFVPIILITGIFYFLLIRPQQKKQKKLEGMIKAIEKGDNVITSGGLHGKVTGVTDDVLTLDIGGVKGERIKVKVARGRIEQVDVAGKKGDES